MSTALKLLLSLLSDEKSRKKILLIVGSIITGLIGMLLLPFVVLAELNQLDPPKIQLDEAEIQPIFDMDKLTESEAECNEIAERLIHKGNRYQALKAQLIYLSYSDSGKITDLDEYTNIFYIDDDGILIDCLNTFYTVRFKVVYATGKAFQPERKRKMLRRGDIYFADLGNTVGSEQGGIRPVLVVQNDIGNYYSPTSIVLPITSAWKKPLPTHAELVPECGLRKHSTALAEQIRTIDRSRILRYAGYLYPEEMQPINKVILTALGVNNSETIRTS